MRVALSGGGTAGHVYPALAVASALRRTLAARDEPLDLLYLGIRGRVDEQLLADESIDFRTVRASALRVRSPLQFARGLFDLVVGSLQARGHLHRFNPQAVFATGGYASAPVAVAARMSRRPLLVYLPDIHPGWAVRMMMRLATRIAATTDASLPYLPQSKVDVTGYPVRPGFLAAAKEEGRQRLGLAADMKTLLVAGGSQGAHAINTLVADNLSSLLDLCQIVHISGHADFDSLQQHRSELPEALQSRYHLHSYLSEEMPWAMAAADLALCRAGASTLGELPLMGLPAVLVPGAFSDQSVNAQYLADRGAAVALANGHIAEAVGLIEELLRDAERLQAMSAATHSLARPDAAERIASLLLEIAKDK